ncbi:hypothetical protein Q5O24_01425 [Eubacteriaceae bacterium ES3]|nr:hypothetical protein Q5O24_01425 [Eubacteriaceae bacterium ES3]
MKKKLLSGFLVFILLLAFLPAFVTAATIPIVNTNYDISAANDGDIIQCSGTVTLTGSKNVMIECSPGTHLTLDSVSIDLTSINACALSFSGSGNELTLTGINT